MQIWLNLLFILQILAAVTMIGLVLLQHGKGADMGASFGSGASGSLFGATGSANFLSRSTAICATIFFAATLGLAGIATNRVTVHAPTTSSDNALTQALPASAAATVVVPTASAPSAGASVAASAATTASAPATGSQGVPTR
ncbi:MAG TPA: preprotein translocase subunit SecG [Burkholderiaceae bacterium]